MKAHEMTMEMFHIERPKGGIAGLPDPSMKPGLFHDGLGRAKHSWTPANDDAPEKEVPRPVQASEPVVLTEVEAQTDAECVQTIRDHLNRTYMGEILTDESGALIMMTKVNPDGSSRTFPIRKKHRYVAIFEELVRKYLEEE